MATRYRGNFDEADELHEYPGVVDRVVEIGDLTVGRETLEPGWRWSTHVRPYVGGQSCQVRHVGVILAGHLHVRLDDGTSFEIGPNDVYEIPSGHDAWVVGEEKVVSIQWSGIRAFNARRMLPHGRMLTTLLFTDLVESTAAIARLGDEQWRELLSNHLESAREAIGRSRGREVKTTGDGVLATFDGPAQAIHCAVAIRSQSDRVGLGIRAGIHVGEVDVLGDDVRGISVHEAARIMAAAASGEILVSETTRVLAIASGLQFEDRGVHSLKGLEGERRLYAYVPGPASAEV